MFEGLNSEELKKRLKRDEKINYWSEIIYKMFYNFPFIKPREIREGTRFYTGFKG